MSEKPSWREIIFIPVSLLIILVAVMLEEYAFVKTVALIAFLQSSGQVYRSYQANQNNNSSDT